MAGVVGFAQTGDRRFISTDGDSAYVLVQLNLSDEESVDQLDTLRDKIAPPAGTTVALTGYGPLTKDSAEAVGAGPPARRDGLAPARRVILVAVFASLLAAGLPLLVAGLAIPSTLALIFLVSQQVEMSIYVLNIATMLGLALAIDYSLFLVSRFREELRRGRTVADAVERAVATSGKAVAFSGLAVAIGLSGPDALRGPGHRLDRHRGRTRRPLLGLLRAHVPPAVLGMLGPPRQLAEPGCADRRDPASARLGDRRRSRRPGQPPLGAPRARRDGAPDGRRSSACSPSCCSPALPFLRIEQGVPDASVMPAGLESRDAYVAIQDEFPRGEITPITILATVDGDPTTPENALALARYAAAVGETEGIDRVESPFSLSNPATGQPLTPEEIAAIYAAPPDQRPAGIDELRPAVRQRVNRSPRRDQPRSSPPRPPRPR